MNDPSNSERRTDPLGFVVNPNGSTYAYFLSTLDPVAQALFSKLAFVPDPDSGASNPSSSRDFCCSYTCTVLKVCARSISLGGSCHTCSSAGWRQIAPTNADHTA